MNYVVCQTSRCQQTYPIENFSPESKNVRCEKCGGVLIDKEGRANFSHNATVIPVITISELEESKKNILKIKRKQLETLTREIKELEEDDI